MQTLLRRYQNEAGGLLPLLLEIQAAQGFIPEADIPEIAQQMNRSVAEVRGVISFYSDLKTTPGGRHHLQICRAESCQAVGGRELEALAKTELGVDFGETTEDGAITLEAVYCLGNCACSPSVRTDNETHARVDASRLRSLITEMRDAGSEQ